MHEGQKPRPLHEKVRHEATERVEVVEVPRQRSLKRTTLIGAWPSAIALPRTFTRSLEIPASLMHAVIAAKD